jgi:hypothetical protein
MTTTPTAAAPGLDSLSFDGIPSDVRRTWVVPGVLALGEVTIIAGQGGVGWKGLTLVKLGALCALGLPMPGDPDGTERTPGRVLWVSSGTEDDPLFDLSPRFASALAACAAEHLLDPAAAHLAMRLIHNLSEWPDGSPVEVPDDLPRVRAEVARLNDLDGQNRPRKLADGSPNPDYTQPGPPVRIVVFDPLDALLGPGSTVDSRPGARRVMAHWNRFARGANVSAPVIHHVIASGNKIAGSPAITNSVRLAFLVKADPANDAIRIMSSFKSNVSSPGDLRYVKIDSDPMPYIAFLDAEGTGAAAHLPGAGAQVAGDTLRERIAQVTNPVKTAPAGPARPGDWDSAGAGRFKVIRRVQGPDGTNEPAQVVADRPGRGQARAAAEQHASRGPLTWMPAGGVAGMDTAAYRDGTRLVSYGVAPA